MRFSKSVTFVYFCNDNMFITGIFLIQDLLRPLILGGDHSISFPAVRAVSEKLGGPVDILHLDAHPDIYHCFEGNMYSHASSFARIMEGGYARRLLQVTFSYLPHIYCIIPCLLQIYNYDLL